jgi:predicted Zn-dependent protease
MAATDKTPLAAATMSTAVIEAALAALPGAADWQLEVRRDDERQRYLIGARDEAQRSVFNERALVTLHNDHAPRASQASSQESQDAVSDLKRGTATLTLLPDESADAAGLAARLGDTLMIAGLTDNPPFRLPDPPAGGYPALMTADPALLGEAAALDGLLDQIFAQLRGAVARYPGVHLSSAELYVTRSARHLRTSRGAVCAYASTALALDLVLIAGASDHAAEFHAEVYRRRLGDLDLERTVAAYATFARDALRAVPPATHQGPVILSGEAAAGFFVPTLDAIGIPSTFAFHTSAEAAYQRLSRLTVGAFVSGGEPRGDRLTLLADATRPFGRKTAPCDSDGLPAARLVLIEDGVFRRLWADSRYAAYLGIAPTGAFGNCTVVPGETPLDALRTELDGPVYEIVAFSSFNPDPVTGDFVSEVKLGYRHDARGATPIRGGSLSGNLFDALADVRFSRETYTDGTYYGPAALRCAQLTLAGE